MGAGRMFFRGKQIRESRDESPPVESRDGAPLTILCGQPGHIYTYTGLEVPVWTVAALHQGAPGQITWLEDPPPWLKPCLALRIALLQ